MWLLTLNYLHSHKLINQNKKKKKNAIKDTPHFVDTTCHTVHALIYFFFFHSFLVFLWLLWLRSYRKEFTASLTHSLNYIFCFIIKIQFDVYLLIANFVFAAFSLIFFFSLFVFQANRRLVYNSYKDNL